MIRKNNNLKIMEVFFKYPEMKFHLRELERITKLSLPAVKQITQNLEKEKILKSKKEKILKNIYAIRNQKFVLLKYLYNIHSLFSVGLIDFLREIYHEPEAIILFGSYSKGEDISKSDIDIAVITGNKKDVDFSKFEKKLARKITVYEIKIKNVEEDFLNTLVNGVVLHGYLNVIK